MDSSIMSGLIGRVISVILCTYISKNVMASKVEGDLKFATFLVILAWCCSAFVGLAIWAFFYDYDAGEMPSEMYSIFGLFFGFGIAAIYCFGAYFKVNGSYDEKENDFYTPWTGRKTELRSNLESLSFDATANCYVLKFKSGSKIRLSNLLRGHGNVLELLESKGYKF